MAELLVLASVNPSRLAVESDPRFDLGEVRAEQFLVVLEHGVLVVDGLLAITAILALRSGNLYLGEELLFAVISCLGCCLLLQLHLQRA